MSSATTSATTAGPGAWSRTATTSHFQKAAAAADPSVSRDLTWDGGDTLVLDVPADVTFTQGKTASVTVTGPSSLVDRVRLSDGRLTYTASIGAIVLLGWRQSRSQAARGLRQLRELLEAHPARPGNTADAQNSDKNIAAHNRESMM
ncbi:MAG: hypothetical protein WDN06_02290 [Asticcacaulis sp.]